MRVAVRLLITSLILFTSPVAQPRQQQPISQDTVIAALRHIVSMNTPQEQRAGLQELILLMSRHKVDFLLNDKTGAMLVGAGVTQFDKQTKRRVLNAVLNNGPDRERYAEFRRLKEAANKDACKAAESYEREFPGGYEPRVAEVKEFIATACTSPGGGGPPPPPPPDEWETKMKAGEQALNSSPRREAEAEQAFKAAQRLRPDHWLAFSKLGQLYSEQKRYPDAIREFVGGLDLKPNDPLLLRGLGIAHLNLKNNEEAARVLKEAVDHGAADADTNFYLGTAQSNLRKFDDADAAFDRAIASRPNDAQLRFEVGNVYFGLRQRDKAFESYEQAVKHNPDFLAAALRLVELKPDNPMAHERLGDVYLRARRNADAKAAYTQAMRLSPDRTVSGEPLGYWHIRAAEHVGDEVERVTDKVKLMERANMALTGSEFQDALTVCLNEFKRLARSRVMVARKEPNSDRCTERSTIKNTAVNEEQRFVDFTHNNRRYVLAISWYRYVPDTEDDFIEFAIFRKSAPSPRGRP
jgi:tetratricopeptide (TPR) repeat protein